MKIAFILWILFVTIVSLIPISNIGAPEYSDLFVHALIYFSTSLIFYYSFRFKIRKIILFSILFSITFGSLIEIFQAITPYRTFSFADIIANATGAVLAGLLLKIISKTRAFVA